MNKDFYYNKDNLKMKLNEKGYPVWEDSGKPLHIYQMEKKLGRKLKHGEAVHHVDSDKLNYDINNLVLLSWEDHNKIERDKWVFTNIYLTHYFIVLFSYITLALYLKFKALYLISLTLTLLLIALIIPAFPKFTRRFLFFTGILKRNKK